MNPWSFVAAAYAVVLCLTAALLAWAAIGMRRAEGAAAALKRAE